MIDENAVIHLRHVSGRIYVYSLPEVMTIFAQADEMGQPRDSPVVVSARRATEGFGRQLLDHPLLAGRRIILQGRKQALFFRVPYFVRPPQFWQPHPTALAEGIAAAASDRPAGPRLVLRRGEDTTNTRLTPAMDSLIVDPVARGFDTIDPAE